MWRRIVTLWRLSGIEVEAYEYPTLRRKVINKVTDVFMPKRMAKIIEENTIKQELEQDHDKTD